MKLAANHGKLVTKGGKLACTCCGSGGECCRVGKVCFGTPSASTLRAGAILMNSVDLSGFGYGAAAKMFAGFWEGQSADYVAGWNESGSSAGWTTLSCAEVRTAWIRLGQAGMGGPPSDYLINVWVRVTAWYTADDVWHIRLEFAGASDGSGTLVTAEDSKPLQAYSGSIHDPIPTRDVTKNPAVWTNGSGGTWSLTNPSPCCRNGSRCRVPLLSDDVEPDSLGVVCCTRRYMTADGCAPFAELLADKVMRVEDAEKHFTIGGYRFFLTGPQFVPPGQYFCDIPAGKTLVTPSGFNPMAWQCIPYNRCSGPSGMTSAPASFVAPTNLKLNEYGSVFTGADGTDACGGFPEEDFGNGGPGEDPFLGGPGNGALGQWAHEDGLNVSVGCGDTLRNVTMPDLKGWCGIGVGMQLVSNCAYYNPVGWDEELGEPIMELVPAEHYYEMTMFVGCAGGGIWRAKYRAAFDPEDPKTPGEVGNFTHFATEGSPPAGMTMRSTISFTDLW